MFAFYDNLSAAALILAAVFCAVAAVLMRPRGENAPVGSWAGTVGWLGLALGWLGVLIAFEP